MAARNGSPELVLKTIGGCMKRYKEDLDMLLDRVIKDVDIENYNGRRIIKLTTHDNRVIMISGDAVLVTSHNLN